MKNMKKNIILYTYPTSPFGIKVQAYLLYKDMPFEVIYVNPKEVTKTLPIGHQIPILTISNNHFKDSFALGQMIDQFFPENPLIPKELRDDILSFEGWIQKTFIPNLFQGIYPRFNKFSTFKNSWILSNTMGEVCDGGLNRVIKFMWPFLLRKQKFISAPAKNMDIIGDFTSVRKLSLEYINDLLKEHDFLLGEVLTLSDLSLFSLLSLPYNLGLYGFDDFKGYYNVSRWMDRVSHILATKNTSTQWPLTPLHVATNFDYLQKKES